jgi:hypothetical protein
MLTWGLAVYIGLWLVFTHLHPVTAARWMGHPLLVDLIVIGSGLAIHGGSADGAMAAIVSGIFAALYTTWYRRTRGYIHGGKFYPGVFRTPDPRRIA